MRWLKGKLGKSVRIALSKLGRFTPGKRLKQGRRDKKGTILPPR